MAAQPATPERGVLYARVTRGELISAVCALALLVLMFATAWFGVDRIPSAASTATGSAFAEDAWHGLTLIRWLMLMTVVAAFVTVAIHITQPARVALARIRLALLALATVTAGALIFRVLIVLPSPDRVVDQKLGGVLGMLASLGIAFGAYEAVREQRARLFAPAPDAGDRAPIASNRPQR